MVVALAQVQMPLMVLPLITALRTHRPEPRRCLVRRSAPAAGARSAR